MRYYNFEMIIVRKNILNRMVLAVTHATMGLLVLPLLLLCVAALGWGAHWLAGSDAAGDTGLRFVLGAAITHSLILVLGVIAVCSVLGIGLGWLMGQYAFTAKPVFEWLLLAPLAVPSFISAHAWTQLFAFSGVVPTFLREHGIAQRLPDIRSVEGAALVLGLALFPYVYILARVAFSSAAQRHDGLRAAAASLGATPSESFWRVSLPLALPAVAAGLALVSMEALADYGAVAYLGVDTLTVSIYKTWFGAEQRATALALVVALLLVIAVLLAIQKKWQGTAQRYQLPTTGRRDLLPRLTGWGDCVAVGACLSVVMLGFGVPLGRLLWTLVMDSDTQLTASQWARVGSAVWHSLHVATLGATALMVLACALVALQFAGAYSRFLTVATALAGLGYALPGVAIAMALLWPIAAMDHALADFLSALTGRQVGLVLMGSVAVLVYAYALRFFAVAHGSVSQGAARISPSSYDAALSLGASRTQALVRVLWPALRPSMGAGFLLAWIDCLKELPATLMLRPFNFDTLPVLAYQWVADERAAQAALPSLLLVVVGLAPVWWLRRMSK